MRIYLLTLIVILSGCDGKAQVNKFEKNNEKTLDSLEDMGGIPEYKLMNQYYSSLNGVFETHNSEARKELNQEKKDIEEKIQENCRGVDVSCINNMASQEIERIKNDYFNFNSLENKYIVPITKDTQCYDGEAIIYINTENKKINFYNKCDGSELGFYIINYKKPKNITPDTYSLDVSGSVDNDGEVDQSFYFLPVGKNKWVVITTNESRAVYIPYKDKIKEVKLAEYYNVISGSEVPTIKKPVKSIKIPNSSSYFMNCLKKNSEKDCDKLTQLEDHSYSKQEIEENYPELLRFLNKLNTPVDAIRFIEIKGQLKYALISSYFDEIDLFYLRKLVPGNDSVIELGEDYSIDDKGVLTYTDQENKVNKIELN